MMSLDLRARLACLYAGSVWGLFWIPLRGLDATGMHSLWVTVVYFGVPFILLIPVMAFRFREILAGGGPLQLTAALSALAITLYSISINFTDVIRVMLLFYLTPIWSALLARAVLGEVITPLRMIAMVLAVTGMLTIFGLGATFPLPGNIGDWMALIAGMIWAVAAVRLNRDSHLPSVDMTVIFIQWALIYSIVAVVMVAPGSGPDRAMLTGVLPWLVPVIMIMIIPGTFASLWGPKHLSPVLVGLLFMSEIVVGAISASIFSGDPFGWREVIGITLIASASLIEPLWSFIAGGKASS